MRKGMIAALIVASISLLIVSCNWIAAPTPEGMRAQAPKGPDPGAADPSRVSPFGDMPWTNGSITPKPASSTGWWLGVTNPTGDEGSAPLSTMTPPSFSSDSHGRLILNAETHANIERLLLSRTPQAIQAQLQDVSRGLPSSASQELQDLVSRFQKYAIAMSQSIPPGNSVSSEQEAVIQLDQLHHLRASYLGAETARALFGEEEAMSRYMLVVAQLDKDPSLTLQQKAERAQEALSLIPASSPKR